MSGGGGGSPWHVTQGNTEMGILNERWRGAATNLRSIKEKKKKQGTTAAELFRTSGSLEDRSFVPEGFRSSGEILRQFDLDRAEAGQKQAGQLQSRSGMRAEAGGTSYTGVQSEAELMGKRYSHIYQPSTDPNLTAEQRREQELVAKFRGQRVGGGGGRSTTETKLSGTDNPMAHEITSSQVRLIGSGGFVTTKRTSKRVMTEDEKRRLKAMGGPNSREGWEWMNSWRNSRASGPGAPGGGVGSGSGQGI